MSSKHKKFTIKDIQKTNLDDTFLGTYFYRKIATYFTYYLSKTFLTPNHISVLSLAFALFGAYLFSQGSWFSFFWGNIFIQIGMVLDYSDGQVARLKRLGSNRGAWFDVILGMVQNNLIILGMIIGLYHLTSSISVWILGFFLLFAWNMTCYVHLNAMIFFPNLTLKKTKFASKVKKRMFIKPQYLSIGSDVYFVILGFSAPLGILIPAMIFMILLGNVYWITVAIFMFKNTKNVK